uniref:Uncharacterized protein n=1 Tax=Arion vulgaris TaxID=1028688 RepID=A0A0B6Y8D7_9EUPU
MSSRSEDVREGYFRNVINYDTNMSRRVISAVQLMVSAMSGMVFGIAIEKGRVFEPHIIREQMLFTNFTMLKMFLTATATGMLGFSLLSMIPATIRQHDAVVDDFIFSLHSKSATGAAVGGAILGCGLTLAGACPGMVLAQVGAQVPDAIFTMLGGLAGAYLYALTIPAVVRLFEPKHPYYYYTLDEYVHTPYFILALPLAALLGMTVFALELFRPWMSEVEQSGSGLFESRAWPPYVAGLLIGSLQIPTVLSVSTTLGSTTGYMTVASQILVIKPLQSIFQHLQSFQTGIGNWWQVFYMGGAIFGANLSATASSTIGSVQGVGPWFSFCGGVLMIYGARVAGGCTSGHGLSGMGLLILLSFVAVPSMFAGGISLAVFMKYVIGVDM